MSPGYYVSLGIETDGSGYPIHAFQCDHCGGTGLEPKARPFVQPINGLRDYVEEARTCHACAGGAFYREDCDCSECMPLRKAAEERQRAEEQAAWEAEWDRQEQLTRRALEPHRD